MAVGPAEPRLSEASPMSWDAAGCGARRGAHDAAFARLARSKFRSRFRLSEADRKYIAEKGMETIRRHAEDFVRMGLDDLRQMRRKHRHGVNHCVAVQLGLLSLLLGNPERRKAERRLDGLDARHFLEHCPGIHRKEVIK